MPLTLPANGNAAYHLSPHTYRLTGYLPPLLNDGRRGLCRYTMTVTVNCNACSGVGVSRWRYDHLYPAVVPTTLVVVFVVTERDRPTPTKRT